MKLFDRIFAWYRARKFRQQRRQRLQAEFVAYKKIPSFARPGHFYSPVPSVEEIRANAALIFPPVTREIAGINMAASAQLELLQRLRKYYPDWSFPDQRTKGYRYYCENSQYPRCDGIFLLAMMRELRPRRIIEVGSGFSSGLMLDINDRFFDAQIEMTFIEPYTQRLDSLLTSDDRPRHRIIAAPVQRVELDTFRCLEANDILFVDSTHVAKVGSDVNQIIFAILPVLNSGVCIHFHDIFYPFEYPQQWLYQGIAWNEMYMLRAFLEYNSGFSILLMNTFLQKFHGQWLAEHMPLCQTGGGSIWLRKR